MSTISSNVICQKLTNNLGQYYSPNSCVEGVLPLALSIDVLSQEPKTITVASVDYLPNLAAGNNIQNGVIYYIEDINVHAISSNGVWLSLDGRTIRTDSSSNSLWGFGLTSLCTISNPTSSPVAINNSFRDWTQISYPGLFFLGIRNNGTLWAAGRNCRGELGDGTTVTRPSPVSVIGGFSDWCQVSASRTETTNTCGFSLGVRSNGTAWAWGYNNAGQLGDGTVVNKSSPVSVVGGFTDWCQVSAGNGHSLGLRTNGTLWSWGCAILGRLGDNTQIGKSSPVSVVGGFTDWCQIDAGTAHSIGLRTNGTVWTWGNNNSGQLGDNTVVCRSSPVSLVGNISNWCQISAGEVHNLGLRTDGTMWGWGGNALGGIGDGTAVGKSSPVSVIGGFTDWCQVSAGAFHSLGIRTNGTLWSWGSNFLGLLANGSNLCTSSPTSVIGGFTDWYRIEGGYESSVGIRKEL